MKQIIGGTSPQRRRWWEVRSLLWATLLIVCASGITIGLLPEVRSSLRVTIIEPAVTMVNSVVRWEVWPAIGVATFAGALAAPLLRRTRIGRSGATTGRGALFG